jgi:hypothetical protein
MFREALCIISRLTVSLKCKDELLNVSVLYRIMVISYSDLKEIRERKGLRTDNDDLFISLHDRFFYMKDHKRSSSLGVTLILKKKV